MRTRTTIVMAGLCAWTLVIGAKAADAGEGTRDYCRAGQLKCISKLEARLLECHAIAERKGTTVSDDCTTRFLTTFATCIGRIEDKGGCLTTGNGSTLQSVTQGFVDDTVRALDPGFPTPVVSRCSAGKKKCVARYAQALLRCDEKAARAGTNRDPLCTRQAKRRMDGDGKPSRGCFAKLEKSSPCLTTNDVAALEVEADHYVCAVGDLLRVQPPVCGDNVVNRLAIRPSPAMARESSSASARSSVARPTNTGRTTRLGVARLARSAIASRTLATRTGR